VKRDFAVLVYSDGERVITSTPPKADRGARRMHGEAVEWSVDLIRGTYTAKRAAPTERDLAREQQMRDKYGAVPLQEEHALFEEAGSGYSYLHAAETRDPAFITLTRTEAEIGWSQCGTAITSLLRLDSFLPYCYANPLTALGTSWQTTACFPSSPASASASLNGQVGGAYINWDFGDNDKATFAYQTVSVSANSGGYGTGWVSQSQSGEFSWLLHGRDFAGTVYTRPSSCDRGPTGGGGPGDGDGDPGGDPGGGSGPTCVNVYDGVSGDYLGECCGYTTIQIVECAAGYL
jgi:hypothetical protein